MAHSSIPHALVPHNNRHWAATRKAERRREDFRSALTELGDLLGEIAATPTDDEDNRAPLLLQLVEREIAELWRLIDEDTP